MKKVDIVVCTYNNKEIIDKCLKSIFNQTYKNFNCFVIDDNSTDSTIAYIKAKYKKVKIYKKKEKSGPSISRNIALSISKSEYIAFLDSDIELDKNWLKESLSLMESDKNIAISGSKLFYSQEKRIINSVGGHLSRFGIGYDIGKGNKDSYSGKNDLLYVCSAAILTRKSIIKNIGSFDGSFFYGYEDTDLGWRANLAGYKVVFNPKAVAYHNVNSTVSNMNKEVIFHSTKNKIRMLLKNYGAFHLCLYLPILLFILLADAILRKPRLARFGGIIWNIRNLKDTLKERKKVQSLRKRKDKELFSLF